MARKESARKRPDYLHDVIAAVEMMDAKRLAKEDFSKEHEKAVRAIRVANSANGQGYISISKARHLIQEMRRTSKGKSEKSAQGQKGSNASR